MLPSHLFAFIGVVGINTLLLSSSILFHLLFLFASGLSLLFLLFICTKASGHSSNRCSKYCGDAGLYKRKR